MEVIELKELRSELIKNNIENMKKLRILVSERIKSVNSEKFNFEEIQFWSEHFKITKEDFILKVLMISYIDYYKFLKNKNANIQSKLYNKLKEDKIKKIELKYTKSINLNTRNYYNKIRLCKDSSERQLNIIDFSLHVLKKPRGLIKRVIKDKDSKTRFCVGKYINSKLPSNYVNSNINNIQDILYKSLGNMIIKLGLKINKEDYEDKIQDGISFLIEKGNSLDKNNIEIINDESLEFKDKHKKMFYWKSYYFYLNEFKKHKYLKEVEFTERVLYNKNSDD